MKVEFIEYLKLIGITTEGYLKRIETIMEVYSELCQEEIIDIFVDDYIKEDGTREYENITFYSKDHEFTATQFLTNDNYIISKRMTKVNALTIKTKNYDFKKTTEESRFNVKANYDTSGVYGSFKASKDNCDKLKQILDKYLLPII